MSRRSVTTISIQVRLRIPPGSNTAALLEWVRQAIRDRKLREKTVMYSTAEDEKELRPNPLASLDTDSMIVKLEKKETTYL